MRTMGLALLALGGAALAASGRVAAQSIDDAAAYAAMVLTPAAGVAPVVLPYMTGELQRSVGVSGRYGHLTGRQLNAYAADITFRAGKGSAGIEAGYLAAGCEGCDGHFMAAAHVEGPLATSGSRDGALFALGLQGTLGFAAPSGGSLWALDADVPLSFSVSAGRAHIVPFVSPGAGLGLASGGGSSNTGFRFSLGGGIGVMDIAPGVGVTLGVRKVFITDGKTVIGGGLSWTPPR